MAMRTSHPNPLVSAYLDQLDSAATGLPASRRTELIAEIRAHIDDALAEAGATDEVTVRNVLERLGAPEEIVAAATGPRMEPVRTRGKLEIAALVVLALSGIVPVLGWAVGVVLVLSSEAWSRRDKAIGLVLGLAPILLGAIGVVAASAPSRSAVPGADPQMMADGAGGLGPIELLVLVGWGVLSGPVSAAYLAYRLRHQHPASPGGQLAAAGAGD
jgi:hypothetical protein